MRPGQLLTAKRLEKENACSEAVRLFRHKWPKGVRLTRKFFREVARSRAEVFANALYWFRRHEGLFNQRQRSKFYDAWSGRYGRHEADAMWEGLKAK